jgi:hypothetical protein
MNRVRRVEKKGGWFFNGVDIQDRIYRLGILELENFIKELIRSGLAMGGRIFVGLDRCGAWQGVF